VTDDAAQPDVGFGLPENCQATPAGALAICARCGRAFDRYNGKAPCGVMSFGRIRERLDLEIVNARAAAAVVSKLKERGEPADPLHELNRAAELMAISRLIDRITSTDAILDILNPKRRKAGN
jgi:hypothetical protein